MSMTYTREYKFQTEKGAKAEVTMEAKVEDLHGGQEELEEILHELALHSHNFYLGLGRVIAGEG